MNILKIFFNIFYALLIFFCTDRAFSSNNLLDEKEDKNSLEDECLSIMVGMDLMEADSLVKAKNSRTKTTFNEGNGHIKYWSFNIKNDSNILIPSGDICLIEYDKFHKVLSVKFLRQ
jgi:hypothetical protein